MSVPYLVGNFTSKADYDRKKADLKKLLKLQIALNTEADRASMRTAGIMEGVRPAPIPEVEVSETLLDYNAQRQQAIEYAKEKLKATDALTFVDKYLKDLDDLVEFNRSWGDFQEAIQNVQMVDASYMNTLWKKFLKQAAAGSSDYASVANLQQEVDQAARDILAMLEGVVSDAEYASMEQKVQDAAKKYDLDALRQLKKIAVRRAAQGETQQRAEAGARSAIARAQTRASEEAAQRGATFTEAAQQASERASIRRVRKQTATQAAAEAVKRAYKKTAKQSAQTARAKTTGRMTATEAAQVAAERATAREQVQAAADAELRKAGYRVAAREAAKTARENTQRTSELKLVEKAQQMRQQMEPSIEPSTKPRASAKKGVKLPARVATRTGAKKTNPWIEHVKANKGKSMAELRKTYRSSV
jgi:hypothetical protein